ncbi:MAG: hypothetical protein J0L87_04310 [Bacteroidetes bacterium]|nr:hypothetical protein [Bacteroidota bacterium]
MDKKELQLLFEKTFADRGGLFNTNILEDGLKAKFNLYKERAEKYIESFRQHTSLVKDPPVIYFDFIYNTKLNAVATITKEKVYLIGVNSGTIIILNDLFLRMMSYPTLVKQVGDPSVETQQNPTLEKYYFDATKLVSSKDSDFNYYEIAQPIDKVRQEYADHLIEIAIDFLVAHELTHIINGHVDYKFHLFGISFFDEQNVEVKDHDEILTIQTLEMDADAMATSKGLGNAYRRFTGGQSVSEERKIFYSNFTDVIFNWVLSVSTLIRIMVESSNYKDSDTNSKTHPHPGVRYGMLLTTVDEYMKKYCPKEYESFPQATYGQLTTAVEDTYVCITGNKINAKEYLQAIKKGKEYVPAVLEKWGKIRNDLMQLAYVKLV